MISIVYCTREENKQHCEHLLKVCGNPNVEVIEYINKGEGLTKFYNKGLNETKHDIVLFIHDDVIIDSKQIASKIVRMFDNNLDYGIIGVAGTKYMSESGRWWDKPKSMYGRVAHTHEGKTWLSEYSPDQNKRLEETIIVDGLFFAVNKNRIKKQFDESVQGFHFYDVDFSFQNHLEGVKVGVTTEIKVTHKSIGMTNDQWELNRQVFAEKFKDKLPVKIDETFGHRRLKIMYVTLTDDIDNKINLVKELKNLNCDVTVVSDLQPKDLLTLKQMNVKSFTLTEPPGFKIGDGVFGIKTNDGFIQSEVGKTYKINNVNFDIIYVNSEQLYKHYKSMYPESIVIDIESKEYYICDKKPEGYKNLFIESFNNA